LQKAVIRLTSVTNAIRAQKLLERRGIRAQIKKGVRSMNITGCSHGIEINWEYLDTVTQVLYQSGIRIMDISQF
jgi:hypothetical protein